MSYRTIRQTGLGSAYADTMSDYYKAQALASLREQNAKISDEAVKKLDVSAKYAGPLQRAEAEAFDVLLESGSAGQMPSPQQFAPIAQKLAASTAAIGATAACSPLAVAAPLCGAMAAFVTEKIADAIVGTSGTGCTPKVNGLCYSEWIARVYARQLAMCPPGDSGCRARVKSIQDMWTKGFNINYSKWLQWQTQCSAYQSYSGGPLDKNPSSAPLDCWTQCKDPTTGKLNAFCPIKEVQAYRAPAPPPLNVLDISVLDKAVAAEILKAKYEAEYKFVQTVDQQSLLLQKTIVPQCAGSGCVKQVKGILTEGIFEASRELRTGGTEVSARKIMASAVDQADGVILQSRRISSLEKASQQDAAANAAELADRAEFRSKAMKVAAVAAGVAVVVAIGYAVKRRSR